MTVEEMSVADLRAEMRHLQSTPYRTSAQRRRLAEVRRQLAQASSH